MKTYNAESMKLIKDFVGMNITFANVRNIDYVDVIN